MNKNSLQVGAFFLDTTTLEDTPLPEEPSTNFAVRRPNQVEPLAGIGYALASLTIGVASLVLSLSPLSSNVGPGVLPLGLALSIVSLLIGIAAATTSLPRRGFDFTMAMIGMTFAVLALAVAVHFSMLFHQVIEVALPAASRTNLPIAPPEAVKAPLGDEFKPVASDASPGPSVSAVGLVTTAPTLDEGVTTGPSDIPPVPPAPVLPPPVEPLQK